MTTIAYKAGILAADSRQHGDGEYYTDNCNKILKVNSVYLGIAGDVSQGLLFARWRKDMMKDKPDLSEDFDVIEIKNGIAYQWDKYLVPVEIGKIAAIGSGCQFAMGAMYYGASAKEAIAIAKKLDSGTGGAIKTVKVK